MWDPINLFFCLYVMNANMPVARLDVTEVIKQRRSGPVDYIVTLREGISE